MCLGIYELERAHFLSTKRLAQHAALKYFVVKLDPLTDIEMLLMVEKYIRGGICQTIYQYSKGENKCMKNYDKKKGIVIS